MQLTSVFIFANCLFASVLVMATDVTDRFKRPVIARIYQGEQYTLAENDRSHGDRVNITQVASAIAGLQPSYVCSLMYLVSGNKLTNDMINDFDTVRSTVLTTSPNAKFDVMIRLNPYRTENRTVFANASSLVSFMEEVDSQLKLDGWWFDDWYVAYEQKPDWVAAALQYAHDKNQTVGGNVIDNVVPPGSDGVTFSDFPDDSTSFKFGIKASNVTQLQNNDTSTVILGHLNNNPQFGNGTESCVYMWDWNSSRRMDYLDYWLEQQKSLGFTYMLPVYFPLCPGAYSFDPKSDVVGGNTTLYDYIQAAALGNSSTSAANTLTTTTSATAAHTSASSATPSSQIAVIYALLGGVLCSLIYCL